MRNILRFLLIFLFSSQLNSNIHLLVEDNPVTIGKIASKIFLDEIQKANELNKQIVFILPTGSSPIPMYQELIVLYEKGALDLSKVITFNMDEYVGLDKDHPQSYYYFMQENFFGLVINKLTEQKLSRYGLNSDIKPKKLKKSQLSAYHDWLSNLKSHLIKNDPLIYLDNLSDSLFNHLLNDKDLPSIQTLKSKISHDQQLSEKGIRSENIHIPNGSSEDVKVEAENYRQALKKIRENENTTIVLFGGIGPNPAHIAFNDFIAEPEFLDPNKSESQKLELAIKSQTRVVDLAPGTLKANSRFFEKKIESVPKKAITIGMSEVLNSDKIVIIATGCAKTNAIYKTFTSDPTYHVPSSILKKYNKNDLLFLIDNDAYGNKASLSLYSELQNSNSNLKKEICIVNDLLEPQDIWKVIKNKNPSIISNAHSIQHKDINQVFLPCGQNILWISNRSFEPSLITQLKSNNHIETYNGSDLKELELEIKRFKPDIILFPKNSTLSKHLGEIKKYISSSVNKKSILGIFYDTYETENNVFFPLSKRQIKDKANALKKFHKSQVCRTRFDLIITELAKMNPHFSYCENYLFQELTYQNEVFKLESLPDQYFIERSSTSTAKLKDYQSFEFQKEDEVLIIAPHPDDAEIGTGSLIQYLGRKQIPVTIANATSGHRASISKNDMLASISLTPSLLAQIKELDEETISDKALKMQIREMESENAIKSLNPHSKVLALKLPFYDAPKYLDQTQDAQIVDRFYLENLSSSNRAFVFLPHPEDDHPAHRATYHLFLKRVQNFKKEHPDKKIIIANYTTPWTGRWNLYDYSQNKGNKLFAYVGSERLVGKGKKSIDLKRLGGDFASRYRIFSLN